MIGQKVTNIIMQVFFEIMLPLMTGIMNVIVPTSGFVSYLVAVYAATDIRSATITVSMFINIMMFISSPRKFGFTSTLYGLASNVLLLTCLLMVPGADVLSLNYLGFIPMITWYLIALGLLNWYDKKRKQTKH